MDLCFYLSVDRKNQLWNVADEIQQILWSFYWTIATMLLSVKMFNEKIVQMKNEFAKE